MSCLRLKIRPGHPFLRGVNLSGADSGGSANAIPPTAAIDYAYGKGARILRLTYAHERMCPVPGGPLAEPYASRLAALVNYAQTKPGLRLIMDLHSSLRYQLGATITDSAVTGGTQIVVGQHPGYTNPQFQDFKARIATRFAGPNLIYEIANEPVAWDGSAIPIAGLVATTNAGIAGIRAAGATNPILFNLNGYGAYGWRDDSATGPDNKANVGNVVDPLGNAFLDIHHYPDAYGQGNGTSVDANYLDTLVRMTTYLRSVGRQAFLGEIGAGSDPASLAALAAIIAHVEANRDVWIGYAWWNAVQYQDSYRYQLLPTELTNIGPTDPLPASVSDRAQMGVLGAYFGRA